MLRADTAKWEEPEGIKPDNDCGPEEPVFIRRAGLVSALTSHSPSDIREWLTQQDTKSILVCGLSTGGCVLRTATSATDAGFVVSVIEDCCFDEAATHRVLIEKLLPMRAHVFDFESFKKSWQATI